MRKLVRFLAAVGITAFISCPSGAYFGRWSLSARTMRILSTETSSGTWTFRRLLPVASQTSMLTSPTAGSYAKTRRGWGDF